MVFSDIPPGWQKDTMNTTIDIYIICNPFDAELTELISGQVREMSGNFDIVREDWNFKT